MLETAAATADAKAADAERNLTDGWHLVIEALRLNGVKTIYGVPGIPITDLGRMAQAAGLRVISFRHEQNAGNAAAIAGFLTRKPGICLTVSAPGFLNGLSALANATTNCFPMILISGSSEREIVDLQQGDYEEMDQLAIAKPLCKAAFRVLHAADIGIGVARAIRAAVSGRPGGVYLDLPAKLFAQAIDADAGSQVARQGHRSGTGPDSRAGRRHACARSAEERQASSDHSRERRGIRAGRRPDSQPGRKERHPVSADEHGQGPSARHASAVRRRRTLDGAEGVRRRHADRRPAQLAPVARQGQDLGRARRRSSSRSTSSRRRWTANVEIAAPVVGDIGSCVSALLDGMGAHWPAPPADWINAVTAKREENIAKMAPRLASTRSPMDFHGALGALRTVIKERPDAIFVNEGANTLDLARGAIDMYQPRKRLDVGTWGVMGIGMGFAVAAAIETGKPVLALEGDSAFGFSGMEVETICRYNLPVCVVVFNNDGIYRGTDVNAAGSDPAITVFVKGSRYDRMIEAFGGVGVNATTPDELKRAVDAAMDSGRPTLINAVIDPAAGTESGSIGKLNPQSAIRKK